jgi:hypothetical protein
MNGDLSKKEGSFPRWIDAFDDGFKPTTRKGKTKIPSSTQDKRYERRWRRHYGNAIFNREEKLDLL